MAGIFVSGDYWDTVKVFTLFDPATAGLLRVWARSWANRGWTPRLLTARDVKRHTPQEVAEKRRGVFVPPGVINFHFKKNPMPFTRAFKETGWEGAALVKFETEDEVLNCGRPI